MVLLNEALSEFLNQKIFINFDKFYILWTIFTHRGFYVTINLDFSLYLTESDECLCRIKENQYKE